MIKTYATIITLAIVVRFVLFLVSTYLNIINLKIADFSKIRQNYTFGEFTKASLYTRLRSNYELVSTFLSCFILMLFWMLYGFTGMSMLVGLCFDSVILRGLLYWVILIFLVMFVRGLFEFFLYFVVEQKFGFNTMTKKTFFKDKFLELGLIYAVALPIVYLLLVIFYSFYAWGWWIAWIVFGAILVFVEILFPKIYLNVFFKRKPIEDKEFQQKIMAYCKKINLPIDAIYVVDGSKRTRRVNANFIGFGKSKSIILYDNVLYDFTYDEILSIIGHEAGHFKYHHASIDTGMKLILLGAVLYWFAYFANDIELYESFFVYSMTFYEGLAFCILLYLLPSIIIEPLYNTIMRHLQLQADKFSVRTTGSKSSIISALKKASVKNLNNPLPHRFYVRLYYSQFSIEQRIHEIEKMDITK